jgi:nucleoprotein TPR
VALREERDKLLTEKESWVSSSVSSNTDVDEARRQWAAEKAELIKARDHAASQVKV